MAQPMAQLVTGALLGSMEHAGLAVATLVEGLKRAELLRQLQTLAHSAAQVDGVMTSLL